MSRAAIQMLKRRWGLPDAATPALDRFFTAWAACAFYLFIRQPMGWKSALRREIPWILRGFQGRLSC